MIENTLKVLINNKCLLQYKQNNVELFSTYNGRRRKKNQNLSLTSYYFALHILFDEIFMCDLITFLNESM